MRDGVAGRSDFPLPPRPILLLCRAEPHPAADYLMDGQDWTWRSSGKLSLHVPLASRFPLGFLWTFLNSLPSSNGLAPVCLKKNLVEDSVHLALIVRAHARSNGRALAPDSPPTIAQSIPSRLRPGRSSSSGSKLANRSFAGVLHRISRRWRARYLFSAVTPMFLINSGVARAIAMSFAE